MRSIIKDFIVCHPAHERVEIWCDDTHIPTTTTTMHNKRETSFLHAHKENAMLVLVGHDNAEMVAFVHIAEDVWGSVVSQGGVLVVCNAQGVCAHVPFIAQHQK